MKVLFSLLLVIYLGTSQVNAVVGGEDVQPGEFPYMVSIRDSRNCHICGGTIIGDRWVITANRCYSRAWWGYVKFGELSLADDCGPVNMNNSIKVLDVQYNPWAQDLPPYVHDLVVIEVNGSFPFSANVQPVKLPVLDEEWPAGQNGTILGWAATNFSYTYQNLQKAEIPLFDDDYCSDPKLWSAWTLPNQFVMKCGGEINKSKYYCYADAGGPVIVNNTQFGVMSYIFHLQEDMDLCGLYLGIFSPVSYFRKWIQDTTGI